MNNTYKNITFYLMCSFILVSCGPTNHAGKQVEQQQLKEEKAPAIILPAPEAHQNKNNEELTPQQKEELKINEDNIMNPLPG